MSQTAETPPDALGGASDPPERVEPPARRDMSEGTVTFLDVLGWKGIWLRRNSSDVVAHLTKLVSAAEEAVRGASATSVLSVSDTIVLLTVGKDMKAGLDLHGDVTSSLICDSIKYGLPLRGATACGEFFLKEPSIMVGAAIDEAASWHEAVDWIGVVQTPSAFFAHEEHGEAWKKYSPPLKAGGRFDIPCVNWPRAWREKGSSRKDLASRFASMGPFDPSIAAKYANTLSFYDKVSPGQNPGA